MELNSEKAEVKEVKEAGTEEKPAQFDELMAFLDADTFDEKMEILFRMQLDLNDYLIDTMAVSLALRIPAADTEERSRQLTGCLQAKQNYAITRFR